MLEWSMKKKYKWAALKVIDVMRQRGAWSGSPILRSELAREAARQRVSNIDGLLDHLMAMDGKVFGDDSCGGQQQFRFRRRINACGLIECWLEPEPPSIEVINIEDDGEDTDVCTEKKKKEENKRKEREDDDDDDDDDDDNNQKNKNKKGKCRKVVDGETASHWSAEKLELAEGKPIGIMREMGAELGHPVARKELEEEARTHIRDATLLHHLLTHTTGKVVSDGGGGEHLFMNCCDEEGPRVFWLEPPEHEDNRRKSRVMSPLSTLSPCESATEREERVSKWSKTRYDWAESKLIDIVKEVVAEIGTPVMRKELFEVAKKHIRDFSLLGHLLKHTDGKVVRDGGGEAWRFMRRKNAKGIVVLWLEPVEVEGTRKRDFGEATSTSSCKEEEEEVNQLMEEIGNCKRDLEEVQLAKQLKKRVWEEKYETLLKTTIKLEADMTGMTTVSQDLKENCEKLLKKTIELKTEMAGMINSCQSLKDDILLIKEEKKKQEEEVVAMEDAKRGSDNGGSDWKNENMQVHKHHLSMHPKAFRSQLRQPYLLQSRGRVYGSYLRSQRSIGHCSQLQFSNQISCPPGQSSIGKRL